jgi:hypothetical protein
VVGQSTKQRTDLPTELGSYALAAASGYGWLNVRTKERRGKRVRCRRMEKLA